MANSPQKRKASDMTTDELTISRSGRVRKPKVFYDPSVEAKRRSLPNMEAPKSKKAVKQPSMEFEVPPGDELLTPEPSSTPTPAQEPQQIETKKPEKVVFIQEKPKVPTVKAASINNRRKTIGSVPVFDAENGCIVCSRSDIKKGRFVHCTDCNKRGHFTCLRNEKLFRTADQEHNWQCSNCKFCEYCQKYKPNEQLYKCIICHNSYHLHCSSKISPLAKSVVKKKFTCGVCMKGSSLIKQTDSTKSLIPNRKSEGFPGFAHEESSKVEYKSAVEPKARKVFFIPPAPRKKGSSTSSKSSVNDNKESNDIALNFDIKVEKKSPTPEQEVAEPIEFTEDQLKFDAKSNKPIAVRNDLVSLAKVKEDDIRLECDEDKMDIEYDTKTAVTPHESVPDVRKWDCDEVYTYFMGMTTPEFAQLLKDNQIDGDALLLIKREDVLNRFNLKLGPALRMYSHIVALQYKNNNPILAWNEF